MDPPGVFIVFDIFTFFLYRYRYRYSSRYCWHFIAPAETRSWDLEVVVVFPHISARTIRCCRFGAFLSTSLPWASYNVAQVELTLLRWLTRSGVTVRSAKVNSLYACVPSPGLELASAPLTLVKHHTCRKVACHCPQSYV